MKNDKLPGIWLLEAFRRGGVDTERLARELPNEIHHMLHSPDSLTPYDVNIILANWILFVPPGDPRADAGGVGGTGSDGYIGIDDLNVVLANWNAGTPPTSSVPEPASAALLLIGSAARLRRRGRRYAYDGVERRTMRRPSHRWGPTLRNVSEQ